MADLVSAHSGASMPASPRAWTSARVSAVPTERAGCPAWGRSSVPSREITPSTGVLRTASPSCRRSASRSAAGSTVTRTSRAPRAASPSATAAVHSTASVSSVFSVFSVFSVARNSQSPGSRCARRPLSGFQPVR